MVKIAPPYRRVEGRREYAMHTTNPSGGQTGFPLLGVHLLYMLAAQVPKLHAPELGQQVQTYHVACGLKASALQAVPDRILVFTKEVPNCGVYGLEHRGIVFVR